MRNGVSATPDSTFTPKLRGVPYLSVSTTGSRSCTTSAKTRTGGSSSCHGMTSSRRSGRCPLDRHARGPHTESNILSLEEPSHLTGMLGRNECRVSYNNDSRYGALRPTPAQIPADTVTTTTSEFSTTPDQPHPCGYPQRMDDDLGWPRCPRCLVCLNATRPMQCPECGLTVL